MRRVQKRQSTVIHLKNRRAVSKSLNEGEKHASPTSSHAGKYMWLQPNNETGNGSFSRKLPTVEWILAIVSLAFHPDPLKEAPDLASHIFNAEECTGGKGTIRAHCISKMSLSETSYDLYFDINSGSCDVITVHFACAAGSSAESKHTAALVHFIIMGEYRSALTTHMLTGFFSKAESTVPM